MNHQSILVLIIGSCIIITREVQFDDESEEISYQFERNSSYAERQWNITLGLSFINSSSHHVEDCLQESPKRSEWWCKGPLCEICSQAIPKKFPSNETITLRYAGFMNGILTFPESEDEILIDVILCSYDPSIGIDRFYLTRGKEVNSVHFLKIAGSRDDKYKFILVSNSKILGEQNEDQH